MSRWRREQALDDYREAQEPCACTNNSDLCGPCQAREATRLSGEAARLDRLYRQAKQWGMFTVYTVLATPPTHHLRSKRWIRKLGRTM